MTTLLLDNQPAAVAIAADSMHLSVDLADGRKLIVPIEWYPRLANATDAERSNWVLLGNGYAIEWPDLDEHIGIEGLLAGRRSGESKISLAKWLAARVKPSST